MWCSNKSKDHLSSRNMDMFQVQEKSHHHCPLYYMQEKKRKSLCIRKIHIVFPNSLETSPFPIHSKGNLCLILITLRRHQNERSSLLKSSSQKHSNKVVLSRLWQREWCNSYNSPKRFQWNGQSLAPRAYEGWVRTFILQIRTRCSVNKPAMRFGLRLSCIHRIKLGKKWTT